MPELISVDVAAGVALITLNDPDRRNVLSSRLASDLVLAVDDVTSRGDIGVLVFTGNGRAFCAGADLGDLLAAGDGDEDAVRLVYDAFGRVADCALPLYRKER